MYYGSLTFSRTRTFFFARHDVSRLISLAMLIACSFVGSALAATTPGGACPAGLPVTGNNCFFVAANGSDSNSGTSESSPWLHAPMMPTCSSECATVQNGTLPAGTGIILRGGDTWHFGNSSASPYSGGTWNFNVNPYPMGTSSNPIYIGVDQTWYSGASWTRPILTGDNPVNPSTTLSSCAYQMGPMNAFFELSGLQYYIIDNFEMTGLCEASVGQPNHHDTYVNYGSLRATMTFENLYIHGWSHVQFAGSNGSGSCTPSTVCFNIFAFQGGVVGSTSGETIANVVVDGSDSDPAAAGLCFGGFYNVYNSVFRYTSQCVASDIHLFHDNLYEYFFENGHSNMLESEGENSGVNAVYNNVFRHLETSGGTGGVGLWPDPPVGTTDYFFNNLTYDVGSMELFNIGQNGASQGNMVLFNNTWEWSQSGSFFGCPPSSTFPFIVANNHYILDGSTPYGLHCAPQQTTVTNVQMTHATATAQGYTSSETYAYSPSNGSAATVGAGTNEGAVNGAFCSAISSKSGSDATLSDAATACLSDTRYACTYNTANHTVSCPTRSVVPRGSKWYAGAFNATSSGGGSTGPQPPTSLTATTR